MPSPHDPADPRPGAVPSSPSPSPSPALFPSPFPSLPGREGGCALAVMIKAPRPGFSKTRLSPPLTPAEAAALSACFLRDTLGNVARAVAAAGGPEAARGVVVYTPPDAAAEFDGIVPDDFLLVPQRETHFDERLRRAVEDVMDLDFDAVCLLDADSPTLPTPSLTAAVRATAELSARDADGAVLGACADGGYYLLGVRRAHRGLFDGIEWSTPRVAAQTRAAARALGLPLVELPPWYDVDDGASLQDLLAELFPSGPAAAAAVAPGGYAAPFTRRFLATLLGREESRRRLCPEAVGSGPEAP